MVDLSGNVTAVTIVSVVAVLAMVMYAFPITPAENLLGEAKGGVKGGGKITVGNGMLSGPHYNLNIIGAKHVGDVGDSKGHTMFVNLNGRTKIMMTQDPAGSFYVTDRNGLDDNTASFNLAPGKYNIYARGLGKPGGKVDIDSYGLFEDAVEGTTLLHLGYVNIERTKGKPKGENINELFYVDVTLCLEVDLDTGACTKTVIYEDFWVFDIDELLEYFWDYNNQGLKLLQVRFYACTLDPSGAAADYCRWADGAPIASSKSVVSS